MIEPLADASTARVLRLMSFAVALTLAGIIGAGWTVYRTFQFANNDMSWALRVEELQTHIVQVAYVLTMSVQLAVATGDDKWEARHYVLDSQQAAEIAEVQRLVPDPPIKVAIARTDAADVIMTAMEKSAFSLVRRGQPAQAQAVVASAEYQAQTRAYAAGMAEFDTLLREKMAVTQLKARQTLIWGLATVTFACVLLGIGWGFVLITARRWHTALARGNEQLGRQALLLEEANRDLDLKVAGRTAEVVEIARNLRASEQNYRGLIEQSLAGIYIIQQGKFVYLNSRAAEILGQSSASEILGTDPLEWIVEGDRASVAESMRQLIDGKAERVALELGVRWRDGKTIEVGVQGSRGMYNKQLAIIGMLQDISERKRAEARIAYLIRVHVVLSGINALIVRAQDRDELFGEACRVAVEEGGFRMSLIAIVDRSAMKLVLVATAGKDDELLDAIKSALASSEGTATTMVARAISEKKTIVANDSQNDPRVLFGKKYAESGVRSMVVLPLIVSDVAIGALALYSSEIDFFQEEELKLLTELAGNIAFAMDHIEKQERLNYLAYYDVLTGLANRTLFLERVAQYIRSAASGGHQLAVALIDLERFKNINDSLGRPAGDALLRQVAEWLRRTTGDASLLARVGADHFAGVLPEVKQGGDVARLLEKTMNAFLEHSFHLDDAVFRIAVKVGVALFPDDGADADTLFRNAEAALKKAKASGERYLFHTQTMTEAVAGTLTLENQLRQALDNGEFVLHYQPKVNLASGKLTSAEALIRWNDPRTGLVPPGRFIPILEETGLINEVGRWALRKAIEDYLRWRSAGLAAVRIAVNVSPLQLRDRGFVAEIGQLIGIDAHAAAGLELEITESLIMADVKHNIASLQAIRAIGVTIAIDDFGTGFSSLSYLAKLPVDTLKIDRSFVIDMTAGPEGLALVSTIISLAHSLKLKVVAEGVETEQQSRLLRLLNCDEMQGFLFSKPVPGEIFEARFLTPPSAA
jgi:diguanylate cyclase (GGDEF)-like protein/PAS domain S-box-containing protein